MGQPYCHNRFYKKYAKILHEAIPYIHLHQHQSCEYQHGAPQPSLGSMPQHQLCCPKVDPEPGIPGWLQDNTVAVSYLITQGNFTPLQGVVLSLAFLLPASLTPSCRWAFLPSIPDHSSVTNYHC